MNDYIYGIKYFTTQINVCFTLCSLFSNTLLLYSLIRHRKIDRYIFNLSIQHILQKALSTRRVSNLLEFKVFCCIHKFNNNQYIKPLQPSFKKHLSGFAKSLKTNKLPQQQHFSILEDENPYLFWWLLATQFGLLDYSKLDKKFHLP